ncbi:MAG: hypothetical protein LLG20_12900 [Acidobacteriales bacterium]|nr:hypothetical protein [Terriglobales bacterium]
MAPKTAEGIEHIRRVKTKHSRYGKGKAEWRYYWELLTNRRTVLAQLYGSATKYEHPGEFSK